MEDESIELVENRHRREKKELQGQIQALKKLAKNDKSKKKDLAAEIAKLEFDLDQKQKNEIQEFTKEHFVMEESQTEDEPTKAKVSKAQKRRDKKSLLDKERDEQIKLQEVENLQGPRIMELQSITSRLKQKQLKIFSIPSDGDCLYKAIAHQLAIRRNQFFSVENLRMRVADYIRLHMEDFIPFMSNPETCEMLTDIEFEEYCDKIENTKVWGGQLEIRALSNSLKCPISIIQATGPESIEQGTEFEGPSVIISYHRHMYSLGEHYNSTSNYDTSETN